MGRAFLYRLGVTAPFLASSRNASGTAFVASNRGRPRRRVTLTPRLMTSSCRSALDEVRVFMHTRTEVAYAPVAGVAWNGRNLAKRPRAQALATMTAEPRHLASRSASRTKSRHRSPCQSRPSPQLGHHLSRQRTCRRPQRSIRLAQFRPLRSRLADSLTLDADHPQTASV